MRLLAVRVSGAGHGANAVPFRVVEIADLVDRERTGRAALLAITVEHGVLDDELAATIEQAEE